jgi:hypothetical protein
MLGINRRRSGFGVSDSGKAGIISPQEARKGMHDVMNKLPNVLFSL